MTADETTLEYATATGTGHAHGTFGELLQGVLDENRLDFLVTFPVSLTSRADFQLVGGAREITVRPAHKHKARRLAQRILRDHGIEGGGLLTLISSIPEGKGLASSSADLVATAHAVGDALGVRFTESEIETLLRDVEPSDGVMYQGVVAFYHRQVRLKERLGFLPPLTIVAHDIGGTVDTVLFNRSPKPFDAADRREYSALLDELREALRHGDLETVGRVSTRSARKNTKLVARDCFDDLLRICHEVEGLGLVLAHSGTNLGILLRDDVPDHTDRLAHAQKSCEALPGSVSLYRSMGPDSYRTGGE
ncbi:GHMP family kinase ATP-binding protein [Streptomyces acidiscabies]|uniref:GHMP family kinase ATP-binding protein n=1 Tax=Streptomyces acidiscabies TaxID=42234 RepID=UPI0009528A21|nr:kinase [Streptomyces acidiscabies]GAV38948.1 L-threonine kinase [Streptomyces acidiscabies]